MTEDELKEAWRASRRAVPAARGDAAGASLDEATLDELLALAEASGDDDVRLARLEAVLRDPARAEAFQWFVAARTAALKATEAAGEAAEATPVAADGREGEPSITSPARSVRREPEVSPWRRLLPLAATLTIVVAGGVWWQGRETPRPALRGNGAETSVDVRVDGDTLRIAPIAGVDAFIVEWLDAAGVPARVDTVAAAAARIARPDAARDGRVRQVLVQPLAGRTPVGDPVLRPLPGDR